MSKIEVIEVESSSQLKKFINYPNKLYKDDPNYVPSLMIERLEFFDTEKNPFFRIAKAKKFLAMRNGKICGRIATCINYNHNQYHEEKVGAFGFFDCPDDYEIASTLLKVAMIHLKRDGMEKMQGPLNFSTNHECGMLIEGFDSPPKVMMTYNQPYLPVLTEKFGFKKAMDLFAFYRLTADDLNPRIERIVEKIAKRGRITVRPMNIKKFDEEIVTVRELYNKAWQYNWGFVPMEEDEFYFSAKNMRQIVDADMVLFAEVDNVPVGFSLALPDLNQALIKLNGKLFPLGLLKLLWHTKIVNKVKGLRLITFGIIPEYQKRGIDMLLFYETYKRAHLKGYVGGELSWILETNEMMIRSSLNMGASLDKKYRIYELPL